MFKNLFYVLRRFKLSSILNILSLSIAFASFIVIMMQVRYETGYNSCHKEAERIYRVESCLGDGNPFYAVSARPMEQVLHHSPSVQKVACMVPMEFPAMASYREGEIEKSFKEVVVLVNKEYPEVFSFRMIEGVASALEDPEKALICETLAKKFFPDGEALGKTISTDNVGEITIGGVYKDFPENTTTGNYIYTRLPDEYGATDWGNKAYYLYVLLDSPESADTTLFTSLTDLIDLDGMTVAKRSVTNYFRLNNLRDIYFSTEVMFDFGETGSRQNSWLLLCIAFIIVLIAAINYTNFSSALTPMRIKSINTQKVMGSSLSRLRWMLIGESALIALIAFLLSLVIVRLCNDSFISQLLSPSMEISLHFPLLIFTAILSIVMGVLAGLYPSFYLTSFSPALVLKGSFGLSPRGKRMRTVLLCIQYIASVVLLTIALFMLLQNKYMLRCNFGYDKEQILTAEVPGSFLKNGKSCFRELQSNGVIEYGAYSNFLLSTSDSYSRWRAYWGAENSIIIFDAIEVSEDFLRVLGIDVYQGRNFMEGDAANGRSLFIFNATAKEQYGLELDKPIGRGRIIGFMPDIQYNTFRHNSGPFTFCLIPAQNVGQYSSSMYIYFRVPANAPYKESVEKIKATLKSFEPDYPFEVVNLDSNIENAYKKEHNISYLITLASILSILISLVGILSLVTFETLYRRKEIGLRKIMGSTTSEIIKMFSLQYFIIISICSVIAIPISIFAVNKWLSTFALRTPIYWWVFAIAIILIAFVTLVTITHQNYKAAIENPINSVKAE